MYVGLDLYKRVCHGTIVYEQGLVAHAQSLGRGRGFAARAKVHVDGDIRLLKTVRDELKLNPGNKWQFEIVEAGKKSFTIRAVKV